LRGLDDAFLDHNTYGFALLAEGYESEEEVWQALKADPSLAVVDDLAAPRRNQWGFGEPTPDFRLEGFYMEDKTFPATPIQVRDPVTGETFDLTIIAVYKDVMPVNMIGIGVSQRFVEQAFPAAATPSAHLFRVRDGANTEAVAESLESAFLENGLEATVLAEELDDLVAVNQTFNYIVQGFLGLGLIVGVAALGVISARAVVERRQEIGVMRAIGFEQGKVRLSFLIESSMVALAGIIIGTALGLIIAFNVIQDSKSDGSWENLSFVVPWLNFAIIYGLVYGAALLTSFLPARQAARVYPAEALRYE
jgi:putative ABC transport system permease protein